MKTSLRLARRVTLLTTVAALCSVLAYGVGWATQGSTLPWEDASRSAGRESGGGPVAQPGGAPAPAPSDEPSEPAPAEEPSDPAPAEEPSEEAPPPPGPALLSPGARGDAVRDLQARLRQIAWFTGDVTGFYGDVTTTSVRGFQAKRGIAVTGAVDQRTLDLLRGMTRAPSPAELTNQPSPSAGDRGGALDPRCRTGRVLCIDKSSRTLRWVVDGRVGTTIEVRFGSAELPTREGSFSVYRKSRDHVSSIYHTPMPYAMFFSGGQAVHFSPDFAANGYAGASHGCVNVRDEAAAAWLFDRVAIGDRVVVYRG